MPYNKREERGYSINYKILLHQQGGDVQNLGESTSLEAIQELWESAKQDDDYGWMDEEIVLYNDDEMIDCYTIPESQQDY